MRLPRLKVRTLLIVVAILAVLLELGGLGQRSRHFARKAREAAEAEQSNAETIRLSRLFASQSLEEADRIASNDPTKAADLREKANRSLRNIPFFEGQVGRAAKAKVAFERAMTHPWEGDPPDVPRLNTTPPLE